MKAFFSVFTPQNAAKYLALLGGMVLFHFALPQREPLSFALFFAALACGMNPFLCAGAYLISSAVPLAAFASLSCAIQAAFLCLVFCIYKHFRKMPKYENLAYVAVAQLPFIFLYPHDGYSYLPLAPVLQKTILAAFFFLAAFLAQGGVDALLHKVFRCRLSAGRLAQLALLWLFCGMGLHAAVGNLALTFFTLTVLIISVVLVKSAVAVPLAAVLSLPLCVARVSLVPLAEYTVYASVCLLFLPYGKPVSALALVAAFTGVQYFEGLYRQSVLSIVLTLLVCVAPAAAVCFVPDKLLNRAKHALLFYRENTLPRVAVNRNRRAVGEQLYEVSALFREIECAFGGEDARDDATLRLREKLQESLCAACSHRRKCETAGIEEGLDKLIAVGVAKGRVNLIDLPAEVTARCENSAGVLYALNKILADYSRFVRETEAAREGRKLLAEQAHGVSVILRDIALEQSEEYAFSGKEQALAAALAADGILSGEIFLYGEGTNLTVSLSANAATDAKRLAKTAGKALGLPLSLAEKIPVTAERACFILKPKPAFDAAFGLAARTKEGEVASGDTHSIMKIDERRFLVALSDGMGSGEEARKVSDRTLTLLESFYKAKMPSDTVLSTVNRLIALSSEETFSCLDVASVNLDTGCADIVKIGSPVAFLLSGEELKILEGESLPLGMLEAVHPATSRINMNKGDFLVFMSDGVTSAFGSLADLCAYLSAQRPVNPQSFAEEILKKALGCYGGKAEDDMTVLTVKLTASA